MLEDRVSFEGQGSEDYPWIFPSTEKNYTHLVKKMIDGLRVRGFSEERVRWIGQACLEALENALKHGNKRNETKKITFSYSVDSKEVVVKVEDEGEGFDFEKIQGLFVNLPTLINSHESDPIEKLYEKFDWEKQRGIGIGLMMSYSNNSLEYYGKGNSLSMRFSK